MGLFFFLVYTNYIIESNENLAIFVVKQRLLMLFLKSITLTADENRIGSVLLKGYSVGIGKNKCPLEMSRDWAHIMKRHFAHIILLSHISCTLHHTNMNSMIYNIKIVSLCYIVINLLHLFNCCYFYFTLEIRYLAQSWFSAISNRHDFSPEQETPEKLILAIVLKMRWSEWMDPK